MEYCTLEQARSAGATGSDDEVTAAIVHASDRVARYTGDLFTPTDQTRQVRVDGDGIARLRLRIRSITSVTWVGASAPIEPSSYVVSSSTTIGGTDTIALYGALSWADVTVLGAEPWAGGWANLSGTREPSVVVVGSFGWDAVPPDVALATALVAAELRRDDAVTDAGETAGTVADPEGNVIPTAPPFGEPDADVVSLQARVRHRTTGVVKADAMLAPYVREPVRIRA